MATLAELRKDAKGMGIPATVIRSAESVRELQSIIADYSDNDGGSSKGKKASKKAVKKAVAKKNKENSSASKKAPAKSKGKSGTAKRSSTAKATKASNGDSGRNLLDGVDFTDDEGWNARSGSAPDRIIRALRKAKGNRSKAFDALVEDVWDFVGKKKRDGSKRTKAEAEAMLRYRIARTAWDFALKTGQHEKSENRAEYGTAGTGAGTFKRKGNSTKTTTAKKTTTKATKAKKAAPKKNTKTAAKKGGKAAAKAAGRKAASKKR